ncbi:hypothetical protein [Streptomyces sp. MP131-18]|uniref:hypothetical protein n=1 Tax=Streptomyces sp. MP131-18 TaxID=1857892 RepID=UPI00097C5911|nr:hypothetical protein [Streptomyces sp. MP131-18]ONK13705.1 hypothetical protein STBA_44780 [Streptomyces sp. MP131-18]
MRVDPAAARSCSSWAWASWSGAFSTCSTPWPNPRGLALLTDAAPLHAWAWLWIAAGAAAAVAACVRIGGDLSGFAALLTPPTVWTAAYVAGAFSGSYGQGLWVAVCYATTHVGVCLWASAMPEYAVPAPGTAGKGARG